MFLGGGDTSGYMNIIVQHVLSMQIQQRETAPQLVPDFLHHQLPSCMCDY
jgi:hypothetical protein